MHLFRDIPYDIVQTSYEGESIWDVSEIDGAVETGAAGIHVLEAVREISPQEAAAVRQIRVRAAVPAAGMMAAAVPTVRAPAAAVRIHVREAAAVRAARKFSAMAMRLDTTMVTGPDIMKDTRQAIMMAIRPVIMLVIRMAARAVPDRLGSRAAAVREIQTLGAPVCLSIVWSVRRGGLMAPSFCSFRLFAVHVSKHGQSVKEM